MAKNPLANAGDMRDTGLIPGSEKSPGGGNGNPLRYSHLENPMDRGAWRATIHRVTESDMTEATEHARLLTVLCRLSIYFSYLLLTVHVIPLK